MELIQYTFNLTDSNLFEEVSDLLLEQGALAVNAEDAKDIDIFATNEEPQPLWHVTKVSALFAKEDFYIDVIHDCLSGIIDKKIKANINIIEEQDWQAKWLQETKPVIISQHLAIYPSHIEPDPQYENILVLDPGLAFGTGSHPTTKMCLEWLSSQQLTGMNVIDLGCGSGILGITAMRLGAKKLLAIDNDAQALQATQNNCIQNNIDLSCIQIQQPQEKIPFKANIILANIYLGVLNELSHWIEEHLMNDGIVLLTGILKEQMHKLLANYNQFELIGQKTSGEWMLCMLKNSKYC